MTGFYYGFANFDADPTRLAQRFNISFSPDTAISLRNLLAERGDVAVVTKSYLKSYLQQEPQLALRLLVSENLDQTYAHSVVVKKGNNPSPQELDTLFEKMEAAGVLKQLWIRYELEN